MARYDNAPIGYTCRTLDKAISLLEALEGQELEKGDISSIVDYLEEVRSANSTLREWGNGLHEDNEKLQNENYALENKVEELKSEIYSLQKETV